MQGLLLHPQEVQAAMQAALPVGLCDPEYLMMLERSVMYRDVVYCVGT